MCGIVGYVGKKAKISVLTDGLQTLEYRGYDSAGIAYVQNNNLFIFKEQGKIKNLIEKINTDTYITLGIGHTRWATHGKPSKINAHPHTVGKITLVHNGIIENYQDLKKKLIGYQFQSETDTEVITALLNKLYNENNNINETLIKFKSLVKGSYALGIIFADDMKTLYAIRKDSPLIIAKDKNGYFIASDVPAILKYTNKYLLLESNELAVINSNDILFYNDNLKQIKKNYLTFEGSYEAATMAGFDHFMLKEIHEQPEVINKILNSIINNNFTDLPDFKKYNNFEIVACGSAYHAALIGKSLIEEFGSIPVTVELASEYRYKKVFHDKKTLCIIISQSGETADTIACLRKAKEEKIITLGIVNVVGSTIARETDQVIYTKAGPEIAVATTKAYSAQVAVLALIALKLGLKNLDLKEIMKDIKKLPELMQELLNIDLYKQIAADLYKEEDIYFIGRGIDQYLAMEGSLKLKEISYVHSDSYAAGELKHGTISLIEKNTPVIAISTDESLNEKMISNIKEITARGGKIIYITTTDTEDKFYHNKIVIPNIHKLFKPLLTIIPLQLIAYYIAVNRKCDIDKPKNLAKSVTVE